MNEIPDKQEMFNRAVRGLAGQQWRKCVAYGNCVYQNAFGERCAWGHVDPEGTRDRSGAVQSLHFQGCGLAGRLTRDDLDFAMAVQRAHDSCGFDGSFLARSFQELGKKWSLEWPTGVQVPL